MPETLCLSEPIWSAVQAHARDTAPYECVGLLFGNSSKVQRVVPLENASCTPRTRFFADPERLFAALKAADACGDTLLAIYHSHPEGEAFPSLADIAEAHYDAVTLIITPGNTRAFRIADRTALEVGLEVGG